jgi:hypothetical protein
MASHSGRGAGSSRDVAPEFGTPARLVLAPEKCGTEQPEGPW